MLPRLYRLPSLNIPRVLRYGIRITADSLQLMAAKGEADVSRFSFIVSTKVDKRATVRNRMKRLLSESMQHLTGATKPGFDCVFIAKKGLVGLSQKEVEKIIIDLFVRAAIYV